MAGELSHSTINPYRWTIKHQKSILHEDENLPEDKFFFLCRIQKLHHNFYLAADGRWRHDTDIELKALSILQENHERSRRIPIVVDIIHRIPQAIPNPYQNYYEDELIEQVAGLSLEESHEFVPVPASAYAIEALEKVKVEKMINMEENCSICFDMLISEDIIEVTRMPCKHLFHGGCIVQWLEKNHVCPLCRFKLPVDKN
ncbi:e3 ubiquitin-protein ligase ring1-like protein [Nicotiana attenuata]|uniref:RING-type E3 ubiquitin transferase n=1 Tax=Nicotiana attenuata TaxID=49451 RepID=A0A1J6IK35_NICAT|nr:e3 ubiquitin-protein ligase ring1-like protein [Nicotiana attenuata]